MNNNLGENLKKLRIKKNLSKEELAKILKISLHQIDLIENNQTERIPPFVFKRILEKYKKFFYLKEDLILDEHPEREFKKDKTSENFLIKILNFFYSNFVYLFFFLLIFFNIYQMFLLIKPPSIEIYFPLPKAYWHHQEAEIRGRVDPRASLYINNELVLPDKRGIFSKKIFLKYGVNKFFFEATNFLGLKNHKILEIYYVK